MIERMEVEVLCGAYRRQPRAEGNCTRRGGPMHQIVFPARACGMEAGSVSQHRTQVNPHRLLGLGQCASQHDARYPIVTRK
jgi:hypothetical protein